MKRIISVFLLALVLAFGAARGAQATLFIPTAGETAMLSILLKAQAEENLLIKLFTDTGSFVAGDTAGSRTELANGAGYTTGGKTLAAGASWALSGGQPEVAAFTAQTWTFTGATTTIKGYFIVGATSGTIYWEELLTAPFTPANNGDTLTITPRFTLQ